MVNRAKSATATVGILIALFAVSPATGGEDEYYKIQSYDMGDLVLETSGIALLKSGEVMICTRRGEVFIVENAYDPPKATFKRWAFGLSHPLGLLEHKGWIYTVQRGELTRMKDTTGDGKADLFETVSDWIPISGNYHEYNFGPRLDHDGKLWVTTNKPFGGQPYGKAKFRGWALRFDPETGKMETMACGLRSPTGIKISPWGEAFYTDNQGEWCNASKLSHIAKGDFHGHPHGIGSAKEPESTVPHPGKVPNGVMMKDLKKQIPTFKMPAVWFPYGRMGKSPSGIAWDTSKGKFGPFAGQLFVGDQNFASLMRVYLEKIDGHWQGACFDFRSGFMCGVIRVTQGKDGSMFVGMANAG
ncbi:MAG: PQQ-dependent sugar dehydrogenase, partial [Phycisphaeraceae bacterium]|nr:PQQ-dependent sugar dehydrogenase [Phycisphaeraceae bacterium]